MTEKKESITRYSAEEVKRLRQQGATGTNWDHALGMSRQEVNAQAIAEDGAYLADDAFWKEMEIVDKHRNLVGVVLDPEVIAYYKKLGSDYQETINSVLKAYMLIQEHRV